jgi:hypothetical protein
MACFSSSTSSYFLLLCLFFLGVENEVNAPDDTFLDSLVTDVYICLKLTQVAKNQFGFATAILWH